MLKPGKRQLRDITDQELRVIVELSHHYGCKDYWGNFTITRIDRKVTEGQARCDDKSKEIKIMVNDRISQDDFLSGIRK